MKATYEAALRLLQRREHSRYELRSKLVSKGHPEDDIEQALSKVASLGYLSDARFAEHYTRHRANAGFGPDRIANELREKGVDEATITQGIDLFEGDWCALAAAVREKRFGAMPTNFNDKAKQCRFLQYRGFSQEQLTWVMENEEC